MRSVIRFAVLLVFLSAAEEQAQSDDTAKYPSASFLLCVQGLIRGLVLFTTRGKALSWADLWQQRGGKSGRLESLAWCLKDGTDRSDEGGELLSGLLGSGIDGLGVNSVVNGMNGSTARECGGRGCGGDLRCG